MRSLKKVSQFRIKQLNLIYILATSIYVGAALIILEGLQTLFDLPFLALLVPIVCVLTPYKILYLYKDLKTKPADTWRGMLLKYLLNVILDVPFILMFLVLCLSVFMALKLKRTIDLRYNIHIVFTMYRI